VKGREESVGDNNGWEASSTGEGGKEDALWEKVVIKIK